MAQLYLDIVFIFVLLGYAIWLYSLFRSLKLDAPFVPIKKDVMHRLIELAKPKLGDMWYDLGSGDGRILVAACKKYPGLQGRGIERLWLMRIVSRIHIRLNRLQSHIKIYGGNFYNTNISDADIVSIYLMPDANRKLSVKFKQELKSGAKILSYRFKLSDLNVVSQDMQYKIYLAHIP